MGNSPHLPPIAEFQVHDVVVRETPLQTMAGKTALSTVVTYAVGVNGPFTLMYNGARPTAAQIAADITAKVNELRALSTALAQLNGQMQES